MPGDPVQRNAEKLLLGRVRAAVSVSVSLAGWTCGTRVPAGQNPARFIRVRKVGGDHHQTHVRPVCQVQFWGDGGVNDEFVAERAAAVLLGLLSPSVRVTATPVALPDPFNDSRNIIQTQVQFNLIGDQP